MPEHETEILKRIPLWRAMAEFYLDTELQDEDYNWITDVFRKSGKTLEELKQIDLYEVFPSLQANLNSVAGEWAGFHEHWLIEVCTQNYHSRNKRWNRWVIKNRNRSVNWMRKPCWDEIEKRLMH